MTERLALNIVLAYMLNLLLASINFGFWQHSGYAGTFMFNGGCALFLLLVWYKK